MSEVEPEEDGEEESESEEDEEKKQREAAAAGVKEAAKEKQKAPRAAPPFVIELPEPVDPEAEEAEDEKEAEQRKEKEIQQLVEADPKLKKALEKQERGDRLRGKEKELIENYEKKKKELGEKEEVPEVDPRSRKQGEQGEVKKAEDAEFYLTTGGMHQTTEGYRSESGVILMPDLWGWNDGRTRAVADYLATSLAAFVAVPKLLCDPPFEEGTDGDGLTPDFDTESRPAELKQFLMGYLWESFENKVKAIAAFLRNSGGVKRIGGVGFGFGAWVISYTSVTCGDMVGMIQAYPLAHYLEDLMGGDTFIMAQRIKCPVLFLSAADDHSTYSPGGEIYDIVKLRHPASDFMPFGSMSRCWIVRGDAETPEIKEAAEQAVTVLQRYLRKFIWPPPQGRDAASLRQACAEGDSDLVTELLDEDIPATGRDALDAIGLAPIHYAAKNGFMQPIRLLMEVQAEVNLSGGASRETPLHLAAQESKAKASALLLSLKADIEIRDAGFQTPLHHAALRGHMNVVNMLLKKKADMHCLDTAKQTPLHMAAWKGKAEIVTVLLRNKADIDLEDLRGQTPYQRAVQGGSEMVKDMLEMEKEHRELEAFYAANPSMRPTEDPLNPQAPGGAAMPFVQLEKRTFIPMADI